MSNEAVVDALTTRVQEGLTVVQAENENLRAIAIQRPRDLQQLTASAMDELRAFPQFAAKAYYSIPYKDRSEEGEKTVMVEGPSVKAANALARHWGNNSTGFRIVGTDDERITIQGVYVDHETGMRRTAEISVPRKVWSRKYNKVIPLREDRLNMAIQAGGSKAVRNAILNALPIGLVETYFGLAKKLAASGGRATTAEPADPRDIEAEMKKVLEKLEALGVSAEEVAAYVQRQTEINSEEAACAHLIGLLNAIEDGQVTVEEAFAAPEEQIAEPQRAATAPKTAPVAQKTARDGPKPAPKTFRPMASKIDGGNCETCHKKIPKGADIWFDTAARRAHCRAHFTTEE